MNLLTLLGTGTCQIEYERRASSVLLTLDIKHSILSLLQPSERASQVSFRFTTLGQ
jgi:hypothetical protein